MAGASKFPPRLGSIDSRDYVSSEPHNTVALVFSLSAGVDGARELPVPSF